jgi:nucleotide-binding universal stress UspA family protein
MSAEPKTVVVFLDESSDARNRLDFALDIASDYGAHTVGLFVETLPIAVRTESTSLTFARGEGAGRAIDSYFRQRDAAAARLQRLIHSRATELGASAEWRNLSPNALLRDVVVHCTYSDLLILPPQARSPEGQPWSSADVVLASGVPGIVVPSSFSAAPIRNVLVAWNASRVARRAVGDAMLFLKRADNVTVVTIDAHSGASGHGDEPGADIARFVARHGIKTTVEQLKSGGADVGDVLKRCASRLNVNLVVAGAYGHARIVEVVLGSTTKSILRETNVPVLISH